MNSIPRKPFNSSFCTLHLATRKAHQRRRGVFALGLGLAVAGWAAPLVQAANDAYSVDATSGVFSTSFTLGTNTPTTGGASSPASGDSLFFGTETTGTTAVTNDLTGFAFAGITFNAGASAFTIGGNAFTLTGNITNASSSVQTINNAIAVTGTSTLALTNGAGLTLGGNLTGGGTLNQTGSATGVSGLTLSGDNSGFTGAFTADNASSTRTAFSTATAGSAAAAWTFNRNLGGGVALNFGNGTINFGSLSGGGFIRNNNAGTTSTVSVGALNTSTTFGGALQLNGTDLIALTKVGTGTLTLSGANGYTGATTIANGTLAVATTGSLGTTSGVTLGDATANTSGVLQLGDASGAATVTLGALTTAGTGTANAVVGGAAATSTLVFNNAGATTSGVLIGGTGTNQNNLGVRLTGAGALTLTAANTYTGATQVNTGTLTFANNATAGTVGSSASSAITVGQTGTAVSSILALDSSAATASQTTTRGASLTFNPASGGNGFTSFTQTAANATGLKTVDNFTGALTLNTGAYVLPSLNAGTLGYGQLSFGSFVRNAGSVIDFSRGTTSATVGTTTIASQTAAKNNVTFTTAPTLTGGTLGTTSAGIVKGAFVNQVIATYDTTNGLRQLNTGTEMVTLAASGQTTQNAALTSGGTLTLTADESVNSLSLGFGTGNGGTTAGAFKLTVSSGVISVGQGSTLGNATVDFGSTEGIILTQNTRSLTINSVLTGSGGATFVMEGTNNVTGFSILNAANTYTGITRFTGNNNTSARLTNSLALQNTTLDYNNYGGTFVFGNGTTTGQTAYTFGGLTGAQGINLNNNNTTVGAVALTIGSAGSTDTAATVNTYSGILSNMVAGGSLIKAGPATQVFSGANTYSGGTILNAGTLLANNTTGSGTGIGAVQVNAGTLGGTGTISGAVTIASGAVLQGGAGAATGALTLSTAPTLSSGSIIGLTLGAGNTHSTLALPSGFNGFNSNQLFTLSGLQTGTYDNIITGVTAGITTTGWTINNGAGAVYTFTDDGANIDLSVTAVPEPSTWVAGLLILCSVGFHHSRKRFGMKSARNA